MIPSASLYRWTDFDWKGSEGIDPTEMESSGLKISVLSSEHKPKRGFFTLFAKYSCQSRILVRWTINVGKYYTLPWRAWVKSQRPGRVYCSFCVGLSILESRLKLKLSDQFTNSSAVGDGILLYFGCQLGACKLKPPCRGQLLMKKFGGEL